MAMQEITEIGSIFACCDFYTKVLQAYGRQSVSVYFASCISVFLIYESILYLPDPFHTNRRHVSRKDYLEIRGKLSELLCTALCISVVRSDYKHTHE